MKKDIQGKISRVQEIQRTRVGINDFLDHVHSTPQEFNNYGPSVFFFEGNSVKIITLLSTRHRFRKAFFKNAFFRSHENKKPAFSNFSGLKCVFEKLRLRDGLMWTVASTVEIKLLFKISPAQRGRYLIKHYSLHCNSDSQIFEASSSIGFWIFLEKTAQSVIKPLTTSCLKSSLEKSFKLEKF